MPKQPKDFFRDPDNPTVDEMRALLHSHPDNPMNPSGNYRPSADYPSTEGCRPSPSLALTEITAQRLILSMEALTLALQENTQAMVMEPEEPETDSQDDHPPSLMYPGKIEH